MFPVEYLGFSFSVLPKSVSYSARLLRLFILGRIGDFSYFTHPAAFLTPPCPEVFLTQPIYSGFSYSFLTGGFSYSTISGGFPNPQFYHGTLHHPALPPFLRLIPP